jgi:hypothetical protein
MPRPPVRDESGLIAGLLRRMEQVEREGLWPLSWGTVAAASSSSAQAVSTEVQVLAVTFSPVEGRRYSVTCRGPVTGTGSVLGRLMVDATQVGTWARATGSPLGTVLWTPVGAATVTVAARLSISGSGSLDASATDPAQLWVRDEGPA